MDRLDGNGHIQPYRLQQVFEDRFLNLVRFLTATPASSIRILSSRQSSVRRLRVCKNPNLRRVTDFGSGTILERSQCCSGVERRRPCYVSNETTPSGNSSKTDCPVRPVEPAMVIVLYQVFRSTSSVGSTTISADSCLIFTFCVPRRFLGGMTKRLLCFTTIGVHYQFCRI